MSWLTRDADFREIFTTKRTFMTPELGSIYQVPISLAGPNGAPDGGSLMNFRRAISARRPF